MYIVYDRNIFAVPSMTGSLRFLQVKWFTLCFWFWFSCLAPLGTWWQWSPSK